MKILAIMFVLVMIGSCTAMASAADVSESNGASISVTIYTPDSYSTVHMARDNASGRTMSLIYNESYKENVTEVSKTKDGGDVSNLLSEAPTSGSWSGTTSESEATSFNVSDTQVYNFTITYERSTSGGSVWSTDIYNFPINIVENKFQYNHQGSYFSRIIYGEFSSPNFATGTYRYTQNTWDTGNITWSASPETSELTLTRIEVTPSTKTLDVGETQQFTATAYNQYDKVMSDVLLTWTNSNTAVGTVSPTSATTGSDGKATTTFTASTAGTATVTAAHGTVNGTASVTVLNVPHAMCKDVDQSGNPINLTTNFSTSDTYAVSWVELEDIGVGDPSLTTEEWAWRLPNGSLYPSQFTTRKWCEVRVGVVQKCTFTAFMKIAGCPPANIPGNWHVDFYYDGEKQFTETFTISSGESVVTTITVTPSTVTLDVGETQQFTATAYDQYDAVMSDILITWTSSNTAAGTVNPTSATTGSDGKATTTFTTSSSGTATVRATHGTVSETASVTVLKPNGDSVCKIAFCSNRDDDSDLYVMDADGTNVKQLTSNTAIDWNPTWSPECNKIAFPSDRDGDFDIYVMNADGTSVMSVM